MDFLTAVLPMTGGEGATLVTVVGLSLAGLSVLLIILKLKAGRSKSKGKRN